MFTVKFYKGHMAKIVEGECVNIFPAGVEPGSDADTALRSNRVREIQIVTKEAATADVYYVGEPGAEIQGYSRDIPQPTIYDVCFVENSNGRTTESIRPY